MILGIEIILLVAGLYALFTAKLPSWIAGKGYKAEGNKVRLLGILMAGTLPIVLCVAFTIGLVGGLGDFDPTVIAAVFEFLFVIVVAIVAAVAIRRIREPEAPVNINPSEPPSST